MARVYVNKYLGKIERTDIYKVRLTMKNGSVYEDLEPRCLFPVTNSRMYITLLDEGEHEVGFIRDLDELDDASRSAILDCFKEYYMIPKITRLVDSIEKFGSLKWIVETDRGNVSFQIRNRHSDIKLFRGTKSDEATRSFRLHGLRKECLYVLTDLDGRPEQIISGATVIEDGITVTLPEPGTSLILLIHGQ